MRCPRGMFDSCGHPAPSHPVRRFYYLGGTFYGTFYGPSTELDAAVIRALSSKTVIARHSFVVAMLLLTAATACGNPVVLGYIPPSTFQFTTVVELSDDEPGGWQIAQLLVLLGRLSAMFPRAAVCQVEVGVPIVNGDIGFISVEFAQHASAAAADTAARDLMEKREIPTISACKAFVETMQKRLRPPDGPIRGAKVNRFTRHDLPRRTFPPKRGH